MAAPQVSGGLAALKSMFPNLGFQDVRDRILFTADRTGIYADPSIYGQGLLDLDAASRPVGGTLFSLGGYDDGPVVTTQGARLSLPAGAVSKYLAGEEILVLDRYQRAPFFVPISHYAGAGGGDLSMRDLELIAPRRTSAFAALSSPAMRSGSGWRIGSPILLRTRGRWSRWTLRCLRRRSSISRSD